LILELLCNVQGRNRRAVLCAGWKHEVSGPLLALCLAIAVTTWFGSQRGASWDDFVPNLGFQGLKTGFLWPEYYENVQ